MKTISAKVPKQLDKQRMGRGFSRDELKDAGTNPKEALRLGLLVDLRRKTKHEENVKTLKTFLKEKKPVSKHKAKPKS
jgi:large subunit ribosomal protein L13e